nr:MAG TPA: hypothetical protein [Caudoviricetes sp.]
MRGQNALLLCFLKKMVYKNTTLCTTLTCGIRWQYRQ